MGRRIEDKEQRLALARGARTCGRMRGRSRPGPPHHREPDRQRLQVRPAGDATISRSRSRGPPPMRRRRRAGGRDPRARRGGRDPGRLPADRSSRSTCASTDRRATRRATATGWAGVLPARRRGARRAPSGSRTSGARGQLLLRAAARRAPGAARAGRRRTARRQPAAAALGRRDGSTTRLRARRRLYAEYRQEIWRAHRPDVPLAAAGAVAGGDRDRALGDAARRGRRAAAPAAASGRPSAWAAVIIALPVYMAFNHPGLGAHPAADRDRAGAHRPRCWSTSRAAAARCATRSSRRSPSWRCTATSTVLLLASLIGRSTTCSAASSGRSRSTASPGRALGLGHDVTFIVVEDLLLIAGDPQEPERHAGARRASRRPSTPSRRRWSARWPSASAPSGCCRCST